MKHSFLLDIKVLWLGMCFSCIMASCGVLKKNSTPDVHLTPDESELTFEQRRKFDYYFHEAVRLKEKGAWDEAFDMYIHCLSIHPQSAVVQYELSQFYLFLGQTQKGEEAMKAAVKAQPKNYWYKNTLASYYQTKGQSQKAIEVWEDMVTQFPTRLEPLMALVDLYGRTKNYEQVIHTLNRLEKIDGKSEQISIEKFRMYQAMDNHEQAFLEMENLAREYPYDMRYLTLLGNAYLDNGKEDEAYATIREVLEKEPGYPPAMLSLASYYEKVGKDSLYRQQLDEILLNEKVDSHTKTGLMTQIILRSERGDRDSTKIIALFDSVLEQEQENADVAILAVQYLMSKNMQKEAEPVLHKILEIEPENKSAYLQLLSFAASSNDMDEIIKICTPAIEYLPEAIEFYYYLGIAHFQKQQKEKALEVFQSGIRQVEPDSDKMLVSDIYGLIGDLLHDTNRNTEAYAAYDSALVYNPNNIGALNNYAYYLSLERKDLDKAEEMSFLTVKAEPDNETYLDTYAWILFEKGKYAEARIYIDQALQAGGEISSVVIEHCGDIYYKCGETEKAVEYWEKAEKVANEAVEESDKRDAEELKLLRKKIANKKYYTR